MRYVVFTALIFFSLAAVPFASAYASIWTESSSPVWHADGKTEYVLDIYGDTSDSLVSSVDVGYIMPKNIFPYVLEVKSINIELKNDIFSRIKSTGYYFIDDSFISRSLRLGSISNRVGKIGEINFTVSLVSPYVIDVLVQGDLDSRTGFFDSEGNYVYTYLYAKPFILSPVEADDDDGNDDDGDDGGHTVPCRLLPSCVSKI